MKPTKEDAKSGTVKEKQVEKKEVDEKGKSEVEEKSKEEKARIEEERKLQAEEKERLEAEKKAKEQEEKARLEAEEKAKQEENPKKEAEENKETESQKQAVRKVEGYLELMAFSREGMIESLEFDGFSASDAVYAVDKLNIDWQESLSSDRCSCSFNK